MDEMLKVVSVEEKPIDRAYNAKGKERQTHLEVMGGALLMQFAVAEYPILQWRTIMNDMIVLGRLIPDSGKIHQNQEVYATEGGFAH